MKNTKWPGAVNGYGRTLPLLGHKAEARVKYPTNSWTAFKCSHLPFCAFPWMLDATEEIYFNKDPTLSIHPKIIPLYLVCCL